VLVVGEGNSGAQIVAELASNASVSSVHWATQQSPKFLPLSMSGRAIFDTVAQLRKDRGGGRLVITSMN
jgi:cation diffusion facilitator CzcD-associated flavoprotein CzcO